MLGAAQQINPIQPAGSQTFNSSGTFALPFNYRKVVITGTGGAGNAGNDGNTGNNGAAGSAGAAGGQYLAADMKKRGYGVKRQGAKTTIKPARKSYKRQRRGSGFCWRGGER